MVSGKGLSRYSLGLSIVLGLLAVNVSATIAQSFNCRSATFPDELEICQDPELSRLDERMAGLYHSARGQAQGNVRQALDTAQTQWVLTRRRCGPDGACIEEAYQGHIRELGQYVQGTPASPGMGQTFSDPFAYCRAVGTIDEPDQRYTGPPKPQAFWRAFDMDGRFGTLEWRRMNHTVYACASGNSPICGKMTPNENIAAIRQFCREDPNAEIVPAAVTGRFPVIWVCRQGKPIMKQGDFRVISKAIRSNIGR